MTPWGRVLAAVVPVAVVLLVCGFGAETASIPDAPIIVTAAPVYEPLAALRGEERFPKGAQLLMVQAGKAQPLVPDFAVTADANISFDAKTVLFAGKKIAGDPWQVWELTLADRSVRKVIASTGDAIRPLYLPGNRLVYAQRTGHRFQLTAAGLDGADAHPLSYMQAGALPADVLADGRILFEAAFPLGAELSRNPARGVTPELYLVYSDGSGVESYRCDHGSARWGGHQLSSGDVVFTHGASLARFTSPLATEQRITAPRGDYAGAIAETISGAWLLSVRSAPSAPYALKLWVPGSAALQTILMQDRQNLVEPALLVPRLTPKRHPSALHEWSYANLLALDARESREGMLKITPARVRLETLDAAGHPVALGTAPVEADGSFFVQTPADKPIRFVLLDQKGATLRQEHGWFWVRSGEQRICVGCHAGPEHAPENRVPAVLLRSTAPVDLTGNRQPIAQGGH